MTKSRRPAARSRSLTRVSDHLSFSFSAADADLFCYGSAAGSALVLGAQRDEQHATATISAADIEAGRFDLAIDGVCEGRLEALGPAWHNPVGERREWLCRLRAAIVGGGEVAGFGHVALGAEPGGDALARSVWMCFDGELAFVVAAERRRPRDGHGDESVAAYLGRGVPLAEVAIEEPRLSSTYRADGQLLRAGLELWEEDAEGDEGGAHDRLRALRVGGETIVAGELRGAGGISVAFLAWHHDGRAGTGAYTIGRSER